MADQRHDPPTPINATNEYAADPLPAGAVPRAVADSRPTDFYACVNCGYNIIGAVVGTPCPECGFIVGTATKQKTGKAITSMVLGICSIPLTCIYGVGMLVGIVAIVFWVLAGRAVKDGTSPKSSLAMARAGGICGIVGVVLGGLAIAWIVFIFSMMFGAMNAAGGAGAWNQGFAPPPGVPNNAVQQLNMTTREMEWVDPVTGTVYTPTAAQEFEGEPAPSGEIAEVAPGTEAEPEDAGP